MPEPNLKLLILTNMGPKPATPFQGRFVANQHAALTEQQLDADYHYMRWHSDSWLNRRCKYLVFLLDFFYRCLLRRKKYDIIHVHFFFPTVLFALLYRYLRNSKAKIVVTCHGNDVYHYHPPSSLYRWCANKIDAWVFSSKALQQHFFMMPQKSIVLPAGIHADFMHAQAFSKDEKDIDLLYVGTLDFNKGLDRLQAILPELTDLKIVIAGTGPLQSQLIALQLDFPNLSVLGAQDTAELIKLYQRARCYINFSRNESFGLVMAEAMACYTPVVATETDGADAQIVDGVTGFRVTQRQEKECLKELVFKIRQLIQLDESEYCKIQKNCRSQAEKVLLPVIATKLKAYYQEIK